MATIGELVKCGALELMAIKLAAYQQPLRQMHVTVGFKEWTRNDLRNIPATQWGGQVPVVDQVIDLLRQFRSGGRLHFDRQINYLHPVGSGVWELKTGDVRLFGWFVGLDSFIASTGSDANFLKASPRVRYAQCVDYVVRERDDLDLNNPKFISSTDLKDVIST